jgi:hypothetical protein
MNKRTGLFSGISYVHAGRLLILLIVVFQLSRLPVLPQGMDIYYHLLSGWGYLQAGGYPAWDFWEFAPLGKEHFYPPLFHLIVSFFLSLKVSPILIAKASEVCLPILLILVMWFFARRNFGERFGFCVAVASCSSYVFFQNTVTHLPSTLALIFFFLSLDQLLKKQYARAFLLVCLCPYAHIGIGGFAGLFYFIFGLFRRELRTVMFFLLLMFFLVSAPILWLQMHYVGHIATAGLSLAEKNNLMVKPADYILAFVAIWLIYLKKKRDLYPALFCFLVSSLPFLLYPYRFFCAEGYIAVIFLCAVFWESLFEWSERHLSLKITCVSAIIFVLLVSPSLAVSLNRKAIIGPSLKLVLWDSVLSRMVRVQVKTLWYPEEYLPLVSWLRGHTTDREIIYSDLNMAGVIASGIAGRRTANGMIPDLNSQGELESIRYARVAIVSKDSAFQVRQRFDTGPDWRRIGEGKAFVWYENLSAARGTQISAARVSFGIIRVLVLAWITLFFLTFIPKRLLTAKKP